MKKSLIAGVLAISTFGMVIPDVTASAQTVTQHYRYHRYNRYRHYSGHGNCLRFNKTTGSVAGAVGGGLLGHALIGGPAGLLVGAAAGGLAGHELAHNRRKRC